VAESVENKIKFKIQSNKRGKIFFPESFMEIGSQAAIHQALKRLEDKREIVRIAHGIYLFPKKHKTLGVLYPSIEQIAEAIAKRDKARLIPTGIQALNKLGLSTQIPLNSVYLTDGSPRTISIGKRKIKFKKASPKLLAAKGDNNVLVIQALREIGKESITEETITQINKLLEKTNTEHIKHDLKLAPNWISQIMKDYLKQANYHD
jgi:hypothetical protein